MRSIFIISACAALILAAPRPQEIDFDQVDAAPDVNIVTPPVGVTSESVAIVPAGEAVIVGSQAVTDTTTTKRDIGIDEIKRNALGEREWPGITKRDGDCTAEPAGTGPRVSNPNDTAASFLAYTPFQDEANKAATTAGIPQGYTLAFSNLQGSSQTVSYLGYKTLSSYDPVQCQQYCDSLDKCVAFNIYFERDPSISPNANQCPDPPSITNIKCVRWGVQIQPETATNIGQHRDEFQVVIAGSNGYNKIAGPGAQSGFTGPVPLGGAINAPLDPVTKSNTYMGYKFFSLSTVQSYNDGVLACTTACTSQTGYNSRHPPSTGKPAVCNQVVVYVLSQDNVPQGIYCAMYTEEWAANYATNVGQYRGSSYYSVSQAYAYTNQTYSSTYQPICAVGGCPSASYQGGNCGGYGTGTC